MKKNLDEQYAVSVSLLPTTFLDVSSDVTFNESPAFYAIALNGSEKLCLLARLVSETTVRFEKGSSVFKPNELPERIFHERLSVWRQNFKDAFKIERSSRYDEPEDFTILTPGSLVVIETITVLMTTRTTYIFNIHLVDLASGEPLFGQLEVESRYMKSKLFKREGFDRKEISIGLTRKHAESFIFGDLGSRKNSLLCIGDLTWKNIGHGKNKHSCIKQPVWCQRDESIRFNVERNDSRLPLLIGPTNLTVLAENIEAPPGSNARFYRWSGSRFFFSLLG